MSICGGEDPRQDSKCEGPDVRVCLVQESRWSLGSERCEPREEQQKMRWKVKSSVVEADGLGPLKKL